MHLSRLTGAAHALPERQRRVQAVTESCEPLAAPGPGVDFIALLPSACVPADDTAPRPAYQQQVRRCVLHTRILMRPRTRAAHPYSC